MKHKHIVIRANVSKQNYEVRLTCTFITILANYTRLCAENSETSLNRLKNAVVTPIIAFSFTL